MLKGCSNLGTARARRSSCGKKMKEDSNDHCARCLKKGTRSNFEFSYYLSKKTKKACKRGLSKTNNGIEPHVNDYSWDINQPGRVLWKNLPFFNSERIGEIVFMMSCPFPNSFSNSNRCLNFSGAAVCQSGGNICCHRIFSALTFKMVL